ncbi:sigma-70 family RNA polymerase sigma factor [Labilibaculum sp. DW002]|uniref:Sigma-70 family RNA polymerase sigma factor n=1 Tax=Paralabilibaculum antarcticum TaxID=2912572 RepID=A0ABT5VWI1_9BACT|nr:MULTISPECIES: sigma-70 family RNA polymerase sigma factor [unclassified Labilibaculum]MBI9059027.1 sigma-70 family RNA polymerase sigma factor [Labilibaculum sp.]MDE5419778.1 sigma-70 family RNA polymerase sigma factor [Labilibaculum sp. DW002]
MSSLYKNIHQDLIELCGKNNPKAQFKIYKLYYKAMYNSSLRIVKDPAEAEDIMQEAFLAAFKNIGKYKGEVSFGAWLKRIVINRSLDSLKKKKLELFPLDNEIHKLPIEENVQSFDYSEEQINELKKGINLLPTGYRIILNLYLLEGYDHEEISGILNISPSTSRSQFLRAKKKLIQLVSKKENQKLL